MSARRAVAENVIFLATYACTNPGGSQFVVEVGKQKLEAATKATGSWTDFKPNAVGRVKLEEGRHELSVKAKQLVGEGVMNLKSIVLRPVK